MLILFFFSVVWSLQSSHIFFLNENENVDLFLKDHAVQDLVVFRYSALHGFSLNAFDLPPSHPVFRDARVRLLEHDSKRSISGDSCGVQPSAIWNLVRISEPTLNLTKSNFYYSSGAGERVLAYVVDTGIYVAHDDFGGRAIWGANFADDRDEDCQGHGTHVASSLGGTTFGVAKRTTLIAVKVLGCDGTGSTSGVIAGIDFVVSDSTKRKKRATLNMSLGGGYSKVLNDAVAQAVAANVVVIVAAGNEDDDASGHSPASEPTAVTVGATGIGEDGLQQVDERAYFSNFGRIVDVNAPGVLIMGAWIGAPNATNTISGTSMASPQVCGVATLFLDEHLEKTALEVGEAVVANAGKYHIDFSNCAKKNERDCLDTPNLMVFGSCQNEN